MSDDGQQYIDKLHAKLEEHLKAAERLKLVINSLCEVEGITPSFPDLGDLSQSLETVRPSKELAVKSDEFYGRPLSSCVRQVLQMRKEANLGPADIEEIYKVMAKGGYPFGAKDQDNAIRGLGVSISKNSALFARLPNAKIGLVEWYPSMRRRGKAKGSPGPEFEVSQDETSDQMPDQSDHDGEGHDE